MRHKKCLVDAVMFCLNISVVYVRKTEDQCLFRFEVLHGQNSLLPSMLLDWRFHQSSCSSLPLPQHQRNATVSIDP